MKTSTEKTTWLDFQVDWQTECLARHLGLWLVEETRLHQALSAIRENLTIPRLFCGTETSLEALKKVQEPPQQPAQEQLDKPYFLDGSGMAVIPIDGQMMKGQSKYGGANTLTIRRQVRTAARDPDVKGIMLLIDSPGGTVAGTEELAADVAAAGSMKPVFAHADDLLASAAYWVASQTSRITASSSSEVGSIGTVAVVEDFSASAEKKGIKVHVISTGPYKGAGIAGTKVTEDHLSYVQDRVNAVNERFLLAVSTGRDVPMAQVAEWADGRVWISDVARQKGLIDGVMLFDEAMNEARKIVESGVLPEKNKQPTGKKAPAKRNVKSELEEAMAALEKSGFIQADEQKFDLPIPEVIK